MMVCAVDVLLFGLTGIAAITTSISLVLFFNDRFTKKVKSIKTFNSPGVRS